jgi:hypothetical protein
MRTLRTLIGGVVLAGALFGTLAILAPTPVLADPPPQDPNCTRHCPPTKKHNGFTCVFVGCSPDGRCLYGC